MPRGSGEAVELPAADRVEMKVAAFNVLHEIVERRPRFLCARPTMVDVLFLNLPAAALAHLTKRLELSFWILALKVVICFNVIIEDMAALAALFLGNSSVERNIHRRSVLSN